MAHCGGGVSVEVYNVCVLKASLIISQELSLCVIVMCNVFFVFTIPAFIEESLALCDVVCNLCACEPGHLQAGSAVPIVQPRRWTLAQKIVKVYWGGNFDIKIIGKFVFAVLAKFFRVSAKVKIV